MAVTLGANQYGKAETRVVRVFRDTEPHEIVDYNVSVQLRGDFSDVHLHGDNTKCLTTDATKNTVNAFAKEMGDAVREPESFARALARHFVDDVPQVERARIQIEAYPWDRLTHAGSPHPHAFARRGSYVRTATVTATADTTWIVSGVRELVVLKTTDSEFHTFYSDRYTTLVPTDDRIMASSVTAQWLHTDADVDWGTSYDAVLAAHDRHLRGPLQPGAAADPVRDGRGRHRRPARDRRGAVLDAEQAPLPGRPQPVRRSRTRTRSSTPTTGRTASSRAPSGATTPRTPAPPRSTPARAGEGGMRTNTARDGDAAPRSTRSCNRGPMVVYGLQHVMSMYAGVVAVPLIVGTAMGLPFGELAYLLTAPCWCPASRPCCRRSASGASAPDSRWCRAPRSRPWRRCSRSARARAVARRASPRSTAPSSSRASSASCSRRCSTGCCTSSRRSSPAS